jgi:hypothetical protein
MRLLNIKEITFRFFFSQLNGKSNFRMREAGVTRFFHEQNYVKSYFK